MVFRGDKIEIDLTLSAHDVGPWSFRGIMASVPNFRPGEYVKYGGAVYRPYCPAPSNWQDQSGMATQWIYCFGKHEIRVTHQNDGSAVALIFAS